MNKSTFIWVGVFLVTFGVIGFLMYQSQKAQGPRYFAEARVVASDDWVKKAPNEKIVLIEYGDFECPACAAYEPAVREITQEYADTVTFVFRHFPLAQHSNAVPAALAAEAAGRQGKFWEMHGILYDRQQQWSGKKDFETIAKQYASELKLDIAKFETDMKDGALRERIQRDQNSGNRFEVPGTPTFYLNGTLYQPTSKDEFKSRINAELAK